MLTTRMREWLYKRPLLLLILSSVFILKSKLQYNWFICKISRDIWSIRDGWLSQEQGYKGIKTDPLFISMSYLSFIPSYVIIKESFWIVFVRIAKKFDCWLIFIGMKQNKIQIGRPQKMRFSTLPIPKIQVRSRSCRSYLLWRRCTYRSQIIVDSCRCFCIVAIHHKLFSISGGFHGFQLF